MTIHLLLIDDDPIFRLGLRTALEPFPDLQVVGEVESPEAALAMLGDSPQSVPVELVVSELRSSASGDRLSGLPLCQRLKAQYPSLPVLILTAQTERSVLLAAKAAGIEGYCPKGRAIDRIVGAMRQLASGQTDWQSLAEVQAGLANTVRPPRWHSQLRQSGLRQIENTLARVNAQLQNSQLSNLDWLFWSGRRRELLAARWVVNQLLPTDVVILEQAAEGMPDNPPPIPRSRSLVPQQSALAPNFPSPLNEPITPLDVTVAKLQSSVQNRSGVILEIDILQTDKRRDLLYLVLQKFEEIVEELRYSQVTINQLPEKRSLILQDLWQASLTEFFGKYYSLPADDSNLEVVDVLLQDTILVQEAILNRIPFVVELLDYWLFESPLTIDNISYPATTPEAKARAEIILQNLLIQIANAVIQPLLNNFADVEIVKKNFYSSQLISTREIARFRNNLSWRYRQLQFIEEPRAIFESRYDLLVLSNTGIQPASIYAPRRQELEQLQGFPLVVTIAYEFRDAVAPRLRGVVSWLGSGAVYILTQVLGKAIGLVLRGVIQGVGSALQETRFGKNGGRGK
jgi:DNA-binding NarL/FixJ family response regulator